MKDKIAIIGAGGLIGSALTNLLAERNDKYQIVKIRGKDLYSSAEIIKAKLKDAKIIINLAGHSIAGRWTKRKKDLIIKSRINTTDNLVNAVALLDKKPEMLINASGISIYQDGIVADESCTDYDDHFLSKVVQKWEYSARQIEKLNVKLAILRMGVVLSEKDGAYPQLRRVVKYSCSGIVGSGDQGFSFVHINDLVNAIIFIIENSITGIINLCAPTYSTNREFTQTIAEVLKRPVIFKIPIFVMKLVLLEGHIVLSGGQKGYPGVLLKYGFSFKYDDVYKCISKLEE